MLQLVVNPGTPQAWEIRLKPGVNTFGRSPANDFTIPDPSVSTHHCEIRVESDSTRIKDLGSTNGTFVEHQRVDEAAIAAGQRIRLGSVELLSTNTESAPEKINVMEFARADQPRTVPGASSDEEDSLDTHRILALKTSGDPPPLIPPPVLPADVADYEAAGPVFCKNHFQNAARYRCETCKRFLCDLCVHTRGTSAGGRVSCKVCASPCALVSMRSHVPKEMNFFNMVPSAFKYPVAGDGLLLLFLGAFFFGFLDVASYIALRAGQYAQRAMMMRAIFVTFVLGTGYLFSYLKKIVYATASGDHRMPDWPELSEWQSDILAPMYQFLIVSVTSFGPALAVLIWTQGENMGMVGALLLLGCLYFPMGLLGVAMFDTLAALNPLFVVASILKVPGEYAIAALVFAGILGFRVLFEAVLKLVLHIPLVPALLADLVGIYLLMVETRILGLLYLARKDTLGWFKKRSFKTGEQD